MSLVAEPLNLALMTLVAGVLTVRRHRKLGRALWLAAALLGYGCATPLVSSALLRALDGDGAALGCPSTEGEAIVILGGDLLHQSPEYAGDTVGRLSLERIRYGARLYRETGLPILVTGGPIGGSRLPVSETMRRALEADFGVPVSWVEPQSRNTFENARLSAKVLQDSGIGCIHLVTHTWHMARAREAFEHAGLLVIPGGTGTSGAPAVITWEDLIPRASSLAESTLCFARDHWSALVSLHLLLAGMGGQSEVAWRPIVGIGG